MIRLIGFSHKRYDGYYRLIIDNVEYEGVINPLDAEKGFEYFEKIFRNNNFQDISRAIRELEGFYGGKLKRIRIIEKSKNEKIIEGQDRLDRW